MTVLRIGIDIGGTKIAAARVTDDGRIDGEIVLDHTPQGGEGVLDVTAGLIRRIVDDKAVTLQIGVASAGVIDEAGVVVSAAATMPDWEGTDIRSGLIRRVGGDVRVINDVHAIALAESRFGAGTGHARVLAVAVGTGIGGGYTIDGRLERGARGIAGSFGHIAVAENGDALCTCGARGHAEGLASGPALEADYARRTGIQRPLRDIAERAGHGDTDALATIRRGGRILGELLASAANILDPDVIVIGGGVAMIGDDYLAPARAAFQEMAMPPLRTLRLHAARLGLAAPIIGATALP